MPLLTPRPSHLHTFLYSRYAVNTNDAFVGIDSDDLNMHGSSKAFPPAFDAGEKICLVLHCT